MLLITQAALCVPRRPLLEEPTQRSPLAAVGDRRRLLLLLRGQEPPRVRVLLLLRGQAPQRVRVLPLLLRGQAPPRVRAVPLLLRGPEQPRVRCGRAALLPRVTERQLLRSQ